MHCTCFLATRDQWRWHPSPSDPRYCHCTAHASTAYSTSESLTFDPPCRRRLEGDCAGPHPQTACLSVQQPVPEPSLDGEGAKRREDGVRRVQTVLETGRGVRSSNTPLAGPGSRHRQAFDGRTAAAATNAAEEPTPPMHPTGRLQKRRQTAHKHRRLQRSRQDVAIVGDI